MATLAAAALLVTSGGPAALHAQQQIRLQTPTAVFPEDFGSIQTVRELADGRLLVADPLGGALFRVDLERGTRAVVGREGGGPGEYRQPDAVWPLPGDSTLLVDLGNGRLTTVTPELTLGEGRPIAEGAPEPGRPMLVTIPQGSDAAGNLYVRSMGMAAGGQRPDSGTIIRVDRSGGTSEVARFKLQTVEITRSGGAGNQRVMMSSIPLSPEDGWGVAPDGSVAIARATEGRLDWIRPDGTRVRGQPVPHEPVRIGTREKEEYLAEQGRSGGGIGIAVENRGGQMSTSFQRGGGGAPRREIDGYDWPERKPVFYSGRIPVDPAGNAWVRRHVAAGMPATYDVFDASARRVATVVLQPDRRVIGFGEGAVYVVAYDEFDLNYLERYAAPNL